MRPRGEGQPCEVDGFWPYFTFQYWWETRRLALSDYEVVPEDAPVPLAAPVPVSAAR